MKSSVALGHKQVAFVFFYYSVTLHSELAPRFSPDLPNSTGLPISTGTSEAMPCRSSSRVSGTGARRERTKKAHGGGGVWLCGFTQ